MKEKQDQEENELKNMEITELEPIRPENTTKSYTWKSGDSPQKRWLYKIYQSHEENEDNWEDDNEMTDDIVDKNIETTSSMSDDSDDELIENPEILFGAVPIILKPISSFTDFFNIKCKKVFPDHNSLLAHLGNKYGFYLPEQKFLKSIPELMNHLNEKIGEACTCISCGKGFYSVEAVQQHMTETPGHARLNIDGAGAMEYEDFYDFDEMEEGSVVDNLEVENMQLVLPSGAKVGHKDMSKYYKQKFGFVPTGMEFSELALVQSRKTGKKALIERLVGNYRAIGWHQTGQSVKNESRDIRHLQKMRKQQWMKLGIKHNKVKQTHFRLQYQNCG